MMRDMKKHFFHHPDVCLTVVGRHAVDCFIDLIDLYGAAIATRGRSLFWSSCFSSKTAYSTALWRLKKNGVVIAYRTRHGRPVLRVDLTGREKPTLNPNRYWGTRWDGIWRVLIYDVPETNRVFRNSLRAFLYRLRMGGLQKSVWVSPRDIRPDYADLLKTTGIEDLSYLFEARTVLGRKARDIVMQAWDYFGLEEKQSWFIRTAEELQKQLATGNMKIDDIGKLAREEYLAYLDVMEKDPLLPRQLCPYGYLGEEAYRTHQATCVAVRKALKGAER